MTAPVQVEPSKEITAQGQRPSAGWALHRARSANYHTFPNNRFRLANAHEAPARDGGRALTRRHCVP